MKPASLVKNRVLVVAALEIGLIRSTIVCLAGFALTACNFNGPFETNGSPSRSLTIVVGEELVIRIGGVGPNYASPPTITGSAIAFLEETSPSGPVTPGGAVQLFHFKGMAGGQSVALFHSGSFLPDVVDTVVVR